MDKTTIRAFIKWLEQASEDEILLKKNRFLKAELEVSTDESKADIKLGLRLIDQELVARLELNEIYKA